MPPPSQAITEELKDSPERARAILNFLIFSPISLEKICRQPELLEWLSHPDVQNPKMTYRPSWRGDRSDLSFRDLRLWKSQEMLRIAFREISGLAGFAETTRDITAVAERCVSEVYATCFENLASKLGRPETGFCILAMGKFGGTELNYSSDIDVVFFLWGGRKSQSSINVPRVLSRVWRRISFGFSLRRRIRCFASMCDFGPKAGVDRWCGPSPAWKIIMQDTAKPGNGWL